MADTAAAEAVEISEIEHNTGGLSSANLQTAKTLFNSNGFVAWRYLWPQDERDVERETLNMLGGLSTENSFIYVKARNLLPREIVFNKFLTTFLEAHFPKARLLQIYARQATMPGTILLQSANAIAPLLVQIVVAHERVPLSMTINSGGSRVHMIGNGLAIVRDRVTDIAIHVENSDYTVVTLDYAVPAET